MPVPVRLAATRAGVPLGRERPAAMPPRRVGREGHDRPSTVPVQRTGTLVVQRQATPPPADAGPSCPLSTAPPAAVGTAVIFPPGGSVVDAELEKVVMAFAKIWDRVRKSRHTAATEKLVVDGYASSAD